MNTHTLFIIINGKSIAKRWLMQSRKINAIIMAISNEEVESEETGDGDISPEVREHHPNEIGNHFYQHAQLTC